MNQSVSSLGYGRAVPDLDLTVEMSELLIKPLTVTSVRKVEAVGIVPLWALVWLMSELLTARLAVVSPSNTPICTKKLPAFVLSAIGIVCALGTPVQWTVA